MKGPSIIVGLIRGSAPIVAIVPKTRIKTGRVSEADVPAIVVRSVSSADRQPLRRGATVRTVERVAVTVRAANYDQLKPLLTLIRTACGGVSGTVGGIANVSILTAGTGPDLDGPGNTFEQTQDFRVGFDAPA